MSYTMCKFSLLKGTQGPICMQNVRRVQLTPVSTESMMMMMMVVVMLVMQL